MSEPQSRKPTSPASGSGTAGSGTSGQLQPSGADPRPAEYGATAQSPPLDAAESRTVVPGIPAPASSNSPAPSPADSDTAVSPPGSDTAAPRPASSITASSSPADSDTAASRLASSDAGALTPLFDPPTATALFELPASLPAFDTAALLARQLAEIDTPLGLTDAEVLALPLSSEEQPDLSEAPWWLTDELHGSDAAEHAAWLAALPADIRAAYENGPWDGSGEVFAAGFLHHDSGDGPAGPGFIAGGWADTALPGAALAAAAADAGARRADLGESELIGLLRGWQRLASWAQAGQATCANTLIQRRKDQSVELNRPNLAAHVDDEVAAALALTGRAANRLLDVSLTLAALPQVAAELTAGRIDWSKASLFTDLLAGLPDEVAADIAAAVLASGDVTRKTTGQLRAALGRAILAYDPEAAQRRREEARKDASVQAWHEPSGNAALAGRELSPADVVHASAQLTADAHWLAARGLPGSIDELRALAFATRLTGRSLSSLLPAGDHASQPACDSAVDDSSTRRGATGDSAAGGSAAGEATGPGGNASPDLSGSASPDPGDSAGPDPSDSASPDRSDSSSQVGGPLGGTINLTMPLSAWVGLSNAPGELAGYGPADAVSCRDLAARTGPATRWCLTLTTGDGQAVAHACASHPPGHDYHGNSGSPDSPVIRWVADLGCKMQFLETGPCSHSRQTASYRPPRSLVHLVRIRQRTCSFPGCRRPAGRCDLDHVIPFDRGGLTCECNLTPLCRRHHRAKQAPGWQLHQPLPGQMTWRMPSGRTYQTAGDPYLG